MFKLYSTPFVSSVYTSIHERFVYLESQLNVNYTQSLYWLTPTSVATCVNFLTRLQNWKCARGRVTDWLSSKPFAVTLRTKLLLIDVNLDL